jgi:hypothetical protein
VDEVSIEQASDSILRAGLVHDTALNEARDELTKTGNALDAAHLLDQLTKSGQLTSWQAKQVSQGKSANWCSETTSS